MTLRLLFLGKLADLFGENETSIEVENRLGWDELTAMLDSHCSPALAAAVRDDGVRIARNGALVADKTALRIAEGDEIAFLPPVSGG